MRYVLNIRSIKNKKVAISSFQFGIGKVQKKDGKWVVFAVGGRQRGASIEKYLDAVQVYDIKANSWYDLRDT